MIQRLIAQAYQAVSGWRFEGRPPEDARYVLIAAPHTSNWDMVHMLGAAWWLGLEVNWLGKHTLFQSPFGPILRAWGGIPVDRRSPQNLVQQAAEMLRRAERMVLVVPPEGTRKKGAFWKSGFYHIAREAQVPIAFGYLDFSRKRAGIAPGFVPTGDVAADMDRIRAFYKREMACIPEFFTEPRLEAEGLVGVKG